MSQIFAIRWPKYWSFSFSISLSNEYSRLISFRIHWLDLLAVQGTLKSLLQHHSSKASILQRLAFFIVQLSHPCRYAVTQVQVEEGKREKDRAQEIKRILLFQRNTPTSVPLHTPPYTMLGEGMGQGDLRKGEPILSSQSGATGKLSIDLLKQQGAMCQKDAQQIGKKICPAGGHEGVSRRSKDRTWRPQG